MYKRDYCDVGLEVEELNCYLDILKIVKKEGNF